jgi:hypothetical protein
LRSLVNRECRRGLKKAARRAEKKVENRVG